MPDVTNPARHVALTFDFDALSLWIGSYGSTNASMLSRGEFGPVAVERILPMLEHRGIRGTFFVPGHTALAYPSHVRQIAEHGHEIAHHGFVHERVTELTHDEELHVLQQGIDILGGVTKRRPVGYRAPSWEFSRHTAELLAGNGFVYDSSLMGSDFLPYWVRTNDQVHKDAAYEFGDPTHLVELPVSWVLDDFPHFEFVRGGVAAMKAPSTVHEIWTEEFRFFYESVPAGCFTLALHPQVIGRGHRLRMLERFIDEMRSHNVEFVSLEDMARNWVADQSQSDSSKH